MTTELTNEEKLLIQTYVLGEKIKSNPTLFSKYNLNNNILYIIKKMQEDFEGSKSDNQSLINDIKKYLSFESVSKTDFDSHFRDKGTIQYLIELSNKLDRYGTETVHQDLGVTFTSAINKLYDLVKANQNSGESNGNITIHKSNIEKNRITFNSEKKVNLLNTHLVLDSVRLVINGIEYSKDIDYIIQNKGNEDSKFVEITWIGPFDISDTDLTVLYFTRLTE